MLEDYVFKLNHDIKLISAVKYIYIIFVFILESILRSSFFFYFHLNTFLAGYLQLIYFSTVKTLTLCSLKYFSVIFFYHF